MGMREYLIAGNKEDYRATVHKIRNATDDLGVSPEENSELELKYITELVDHLRILKEEGQKIKKLTEEEIRNAISSKY